MGYGWSAPVMVYLHSNKSHIPITDDDEGWIIAATDLGDVISSIPAGFLADRFGRKPVISSVIPMYILSWTLIIFAKSASMLFIARIIAGAAMGILFSVCPLYICEIAEPVNRGKISSLSSVFASIGNLISYCVAPYVSYNTFSYVSVSISVISVFGLVAIPESPYNLVFQKKYEKAKKSLCKLRSGDNNSIENEIETIKRAINEANKTEASFMLLITDQCSRASLLLITLLGTIQLLGGMNVMYAYSTKIFSTIKGAPIDPNQCTIILGVIYLILSIFATGIIDSFGRRTLVMISVVGNAISNLMITMYLYLENETHVDVSSYAWILITSAASFCFFSNIGIVPIMPLYQGEIFPDGIKGIGSGIFTIQQCALSVLTLKIFPLINSHFGMHYSFMFFTLVYTVGAILVHLYLVETRGKTLTEIQQELKRFSKTSKTKEDLNEMVTLKTDS